MLAVSPSVGFELVNFNACKLVENETFSSETTIVPDHPSISEEGEGGGAIADTKEDGRTRTTIITGDTFDKLASATQISDERNLRSETTM